MHPVPVPPPPPKQPMRPIPKPPHNHRKLPALPKQASSLKLQTWRQSSLPERHNPPGHFDVPQLGPSEKHMVREPGLRRLKPLTPTKPSTLSFR